MKKIILWSMVVLCVSTSISLAETATSDNLLNNHTFDENTDGWILSDTNVKRDANSYNDAGNSPTVRFNGQTSTITQSVDLSNLEAGKQIKELTIKYNGYGCGNSPGGWCNDELDDTIVTSVVLKDANNTEVSSNTIAVPYEDGWTHHTFTKSINETFLTGETGITFTLQGVDSGNSSNWLGPITDNYELLVTYQDYVVQQQIEQQVQQQIEQQVEEEINNTMISGLDFDVSVTNEIILEQPIHMDNATMLNVDMPNIDIQMDMDINIGMNMTVDTEMPDNIEMPEIINIPQTIEIRTEMPTELPQIIEVAVIDEIQEIEVSEPIAINVSEPNELEPEPEIVELEQPEELNDSSMEEDLKEANNDNAETEVSEKSEPQSEEKGETDEGANDDSELSEQSTDSKTTESSNNSKVVKKSKSKDSKKSKKNDSKKTTSKDKKPSNNNKTVAKKSENKTSKTTPTVQFLHQIILPTAYLQVMTDSITIVENISLTQEMIYEQDLSAYTSNDAWDSINSAAESRWYGVLGVKSSHTFRSYRK